MRDAREIGRRSLLSRISAWFLVCLLFLLAGAAAGAPRKTNFVHNVGFSFDYPSKWRVKRLQEGLMLAPHDAGVDSGGRPLEVIVIGFVDAGATDPFDPTFADAFERHYRTLVPEVSRSGDMDWLKTSMGQGLVMPFEDRFGSPHTLYCVVHGELGIFLAHVARSSDARPKDALVREVFSSFSWTESSVDPVLVRAWTDALPSPADQTADHWVFAEDGRLRRAAVESHGGFYSSSDGVLNIVWDHGIEESYLYTVSKRPEGGPQLELQSPGGEAFRLY